MFSGALHSLRPRRQMRLRALRLDDETCHGRAQDAAMPEVETAGQARVEARAVRVACPRHVGDACRGDPRDSDLSIARVDHAAPRSEGDDDHGSETKQTVRRGHTKEALRLDDLRFVAEKICGVAKQRAEEARRVDVVDLLRRVERDCPIQFSREPRDPHVVLGAARAEMYELDIAYA